MFSTPFSQVFSHKKLLRTPAVAYLIVFLLIIETEAWKQWKRDANELGMIRDSGSKSEEDDSGLKTTTSLPSESTPLSVICANFTGQPTANNQFMSLASNGLSTPYYPHKYPPNIECVRLLEAPVGNAIALDFRGDYFEIEETPNNDEKDCPYDYLEVRDGRYGFSPLIGRYCGLNFPREIIRTTSGAMWLYFRSDATLEYRGFKAEYRFIPLEGDALQNGTMPCQFTETSEDGLISADQMKEFHEKFRNGTETMECVWEIKAPLGYQVRFLFPEFSLASPNECGLNYMEIYRDETPISHRIQKLCGVTASNLDGRTGLLYIRVFLAGRTLDLTQFRVVYSTYLRSKNCSNLFSCGDETCISRNLICNGRPNCQFNQDELDCELDNSIKFYWGPYFIVLIVFLCVIVSVIISSLVLNFSPRYKKPKYIPMAHRPPLTPEHSITMESSRSTPPFTREHGVEMVYSTVVPGPGSLGEHQHLMEILPKFPNSYKGMEEDLHLFLCKQGCHFASNEKILRQAQTLQKQLQKRASASGSNTTLTREVAMPDLDTESKNARLNDTSAETSVWSPEPGPSSRFVDAEKWSSFSQSPSHHIPSFLVTSRQSPPPTSSAPNLKWEDRRPRGSLVGGPIPDVTLNGLASKQSNRRDQNKGSSLSIRKQVKFSQQSFTKSAPTVDPRTDWESPRAVGRLIGKPTSNKPSSQTMRSPMERLQGQQKDNVQPPALSPGESMDTLEDLSYAETGRLSQSDESDLGGSPSSSESEKSFEYVSRGQNRSRTITPPPAMGKKRCKSKEDVIIVAL